MMLHLPAPCSIDLNHSRTAACIAGDRSSVKFAVLVKSNRFELVADISDGSGLMTDD
jgi:hypothetical protein